LYNLDSIALSRLGYFPALPRCSRETMHLRKVNARKVNARILSLFLSSLLLLAGCGRTAADYLARGTVLLKEGKAAEASLNFRKAIQKDPRLGQAYIGLGESSLAERDIAGAFQAFSVATDLMPNSQEALTKLGEVAMAAFLVDPRRPEHLRTKLISIADRLLRETPSSKEGLKLKGLVAAAERKHVEALEYFKEANSSGALQPGLKLLEIQALQDTGRPQDAEAAARLLIQNKPDFGPAYDWLLTQLMNGRRVNEAVHLLRNKVEANPANIVFQLQLAKFYSATGDAKAVDHSIHEILARGQEQDVLVQVGDFYAGLGQLDKALSLYRQGAAKGQKSRLVCLKRIASVLAGQGKLQEALKSVREARGVSKDDAEAVRIEADLLVRIGSAENLAISAKIYREILIRHPADPFVRYNLSHVLASQGNAKAAQAELEQSIRINPTHLPAIQALAQLYRRSNDLRGLLILADRILAQDADNIGAKLLRTEGLLGSGRLAEARAVLTSSSAEGSVAMEAGLLLARIYFAEHDFQRAEASLRKLYAGARGDLRPLNGLSDLFLMTGRRPAVLDLWRQEAAKFPASLPVKRGLAKAAYLAGQYDYALTLYRQVELADTSDVETRVFLAGCLLAKGSRKEAMETFQRAAEMPNANQTLLEGIVAYLYQFEGNGPLAELFYRRILTRDPNNLISLNNLAYSIAERGENLEEALALATKAAQAQTGNPEYSDTLAFVLLKSGKKTEAQGRFAGLVMRYPNHAGFRYHHGLALLELGDTFEARKELSKALTQTQSPDLVARIKKTLAAVRPAGS